MLRAIQPRTIRSDRIEEQDVLRAIPIRVRYYRNPIARLKRVPFPTLTDHEADARSLDIPGSYRGLVSRGWSDNDDDVAVRVLPSVFLYDAPVRDILRHIEHRARMMRESRTSCRQHESDRGHRNRHDSVHYWLIPLDRPTGQHCRIPRPSGAC